MNRRAFTILEVALAASVGSIVILAGVMLFGALGRAQDRSATRLVARSQESSAQLIIRRALTSLVMNAGRPPAVRDDEVADPETLPRPRLFLTEDRAAPFMAPPLHPWRDDAPQVATPAQRLDLALRTPPVVSPLVTAFDARRSDDPAERLRERRAREDRENAERLRAEADAARPATRGSANTAPDAEDPDDEDGSAALDDALSIAAASSLRPANLDSAWGSFVLRPTRAGQPTIDDLMREGDAELAAERALRRAHASGELDRVADDPFALGWTLWYVQGRAPNPRAYATTSEPSSRDTPTTAAPIEPDPLKGDVPLLTELRSARWWLYRKRQKLEVGEAVYYQDLPAYAVLEIEHLDGSAESWMFELSWTSGEVDADLPPPQRSDDATERGRAGRALQGAPGSRRRGAGGTEGAVEPGTAPSPSRSRRTPQRSMEPK
ncbi:MAG: hypothetical protein RBS39_08915 [Phycisphaerales bacterium]|jgi:hypothetical protein|nr:hypothetical protein [Phycisphaerales bacterium]